ncbi:MAG: hypothetical protein JOZ62_20955 [Acidobacteriaceae bacterium]|nr:hypothetical protein [Acidobacteriaceae bacterium]
MTFPMASAFWLTFSCLFVSSSSLCQPPKSENPPIPGATNETVPHPGANPPEPEVKRIFGIIPNYRTFPTLVNYEPLTASQKFKIAAQDSFDRGTFILGAAFGGQAQVSRSNPSFGDGVGAYAHYLATSYADFVIGDFMTEAIYPSLLRQDPRYFRKGTGTAWSRAGYSIGQLFWTHRDSGGSQLNYSEVAGNATAVAISNAYYPENRDAGDALVKLGIQLGVDGVANMLKEFSPDIYHKLLHRNGQKGSQRSL